MAAKRQIQGPLSDQRTNAVLVGLLFALMATLLSIGSLYWSLHVGFGHQTTDHIEHIHSTGLLSSSGTQQHENAPREPSAASPIRPGPTHPVPVTPSQKAKPAVSLPKNPTIPSHAAPSSDSKPGACVIRADTDYFGSDIRGVPAADVGACCALCEAEPQCGAFSFVQDADDCWLKQPLAALSPKDKTGVTSGLIPSRKPKPPDPAPGALADPSRLPASGAIPIIIIAYNRPDYLKRTLDSLLGAVPAEQTDAFPVLVSQQGSHPGVTAVVRSFGPRLRAHLRYTFVDDHKRKPGYEDGKWINYYKMAHHYKFAIGESFKLNKQWGHLVVMEDDLQVAPDFFEYFTMGSGVLDADDSLYCVSAWNDNGMSQFVKDARVLRRTDVFPGLGWMLSRRYWDEVGAEWPLAFWDEDMRTDRMRRGRSCLVPEVNRVYTFGSAGNSLSVGSFWRKFLQPIRLNKEAVPWTSLPKPQTRGRAGYDASLRKAILDAEKVSVGDAIRPGSGGDSAQARDALVEYQSEAAYVSVAKQLGLMDEYKEGRPRGSYCGVTQFWSSSGGRRVILASTKAIEWARGDAKLCNS